MILNRYIVKMFFDEEYNNIYYSILNTGTVLEFFFESACCSMTRQRRCATVRSFFFPSLPVDKGTVWSVNCGSGSGYEPNECCLYNIAGITMLKYAIVNESTRNCPTTRRQNGPPTLSVRPRYAAFLRRRQRRPCLMQSCMPEWCLARLPLSLYCTVYCPAEN